MLTLDTDAFEPISISASPEKRDLRKALAPNVAGAQEEGAELLGSDASPAHMIVQAAVRCPGRAGIAHCLAVVLHPDTWRILGAVSYDFEHVVSREAAEVVALTIGLRKARWLGARRVSAQTETRSVYQLVLGQDETDDSVLRVYIACHRQEEAKLERVCYERITGDLNTAARQIAGRTSDELRKEVAA